MWPGNSIDLTVWLDWQWLMAHPCSALQRYWQGQQAAQMEQALASARSDLLFAQERIKTMGGSMVFRSVHQADVAQIAYLRDELKVMKLATHIC